MQDYEKLEVRQRAHRIAVSVQRAIGRIARRDNAWLVSQLRRAAVSVPANIAGAARHQPTAQDLRPETRDVTPHPSDP